MELITISREIFSIWFFSGIGLGFIFGLIPGGLLGASLERSQARIKAAVQTEQEAAETKTAAESEVEHLRILKIIYDSGQDCLGFSIFCRNGDDESEPAELIWCSQDETRIFTGIKDEQKTFVAIHNSGGKEKYDIYLHSLDEITIP